MFQIPKPVRLWLLAGVVMVFFQVVIGGVTRLTDSGLSITEWSVIQGTIPPLNEAEWRLMKAHTLYFDLVYNPAETPLIAGAKAAGAKAIGGLSMLVYQAAESFKLWTGRDADTGKMLEAARAALAAK